MKGGGKTVFSEILKNALNLIFSKDKNEVCCVLGQDAYHFTNAYLGKLRNFSTKKIKILTPFRIPMEIKFF